jgi:hypothetical protein
MPRLRAPNAECSDSIQLSVGLVDFPDATEGYYGSVTLRVYRRVVQIVTIGGVHSLPVWSVESILIGTPDRAVPQTRKLIDSHTTKLAADYSQAGNP